MNPTKKSNPNLLEALKGSPASSIFTIGEVSKKFGVTLRTLRFWEQKGLITPSRGNIGTGRDRLYSLADMVRIELILDLKMCGYELGDIKTMIEMSPTCTKAERLINSPQALDLALENVRHVQSRSMMLAARLKKAHMPNRR